MPISYQTLPKNRTNEGVAIIANALMVEPGFRHVIPDDDTRYPSLVSIIAGMISSARRKGGVWAAMDGDRVVGAAVALRPGAYPLSLIEQVRTLPYTKQLRKLDAQTVKALQEFDRLGKENFPDEPCWYVQAVGVDPSTQGQGVGSGLVRYMLEQIGNEAAYLETATEKNVPFYQRAGFTIHDPAAKLTPNGGPLYCTLIHRP